MKSREIEFRKTDEPLISVVVPLYNEQDNVRPFMERLAQVFDRIECTWEVIFALDPSPDKTREVLEDLIQEDLPVRVLLFSRRIGKPLSLFAGLEHSRGDATVIIDVDLQDPPELIEEMVAKWREGYDVVIAQRVSRKGESLRYLVAANFFYWLIEKISEVAIPRNTGDYRLLDSRVVQEICRFRERHGFLRGICAAAGFRTALIPFDRDPRYSGKTQIRFLGALNIALDGIIPFSRVPARSLFWIGSALMAIAGLAGAGWFFYGLLSGFSQWWPVHLLTLVTTALFGLTITSLGVLGEYLVRMYEETRDRPLYIVERIIESQTLRDRQSLLTADNPPADQRDDHRKQDNR